MSDRIPSPRPSVSRTPPAPAPIGPPDASGGRPNASSRRDALRAALLALCAGPMLAAASDGDDPPPAAPRPSPGATPPPAGEPLWRISLAQWSLHRALFGGTLDPLDFPKLARRDFGLEGVEYVNVFLARDEAPGGFVAPRDEAWIDALKGRCADEGVESVLIMCDRLGRLGDPDAAARSAAVERHRAWLECAKRLGCHAIRTNAASAGDRDEQRRLVVDGLRRVCEIADGLGLSVLVENHGGLSSDGAWLAATIRAVEHPRIGTLPDFGNFLVEPGVAYDRYVGIAELMPLARGLSAKSHDFDERGEERHTDYARMLGIVLDAGYRGWIGIEYEGAALPEHAGIVATRDLLRRTEAALRAAGRRTKPAGHRTADGLER